MRGENGIKDIVDEVSGDALLKRKCIGLVLRGFAASCEASRPMPFTARNGAFDPPNKRMTILFQKNLYASQFSAVENRKPRGNV